MQKKGIVIKDKNNNEWVWIEVPKDTAFSGLTIDTTNTLTEQNYTDIKNKLIAYATTYREGSSGQGRNWTDKWYAKYGSTLVTASTSNLTEAQKALTNGCGLTYDEYKTAYQKMLKSVYTYGGFWIGRYEAGIEGSITDLTKARTSHTDTIIGTSPKAISQKMQYHIIMYIVVKHKVLSKEMTPNSNYTSSLMFGIQWDLVCQYLEVKRKTLQTADINSDSSTWGNYNNVTITISSDKGKAINRRWKYLDSNNRTKPASSVLLTTGASEETNKMNIYDFAGNECEWTLEHATSDSRVPCACQGRRLLHYRL